MSIGTKCSVSGCMGEAGGCWHRGIDECMLCEKHDAELELWLTEAKVVTDCQATEDRAVATLEAIGAGKANIEAYVIARTSERVAERLVRKAVQGWIADRAVPVKR